MSGLNKVALLGYVGQDPTVRHTAAGDPIATFSIATTENWTDKGGKKQEHTEWHNIVTFAPLSKVVQEYVTKGKQLYIEGKIRTEKWTDKDGKDRSTIKINASSLILLGGGKRDVKEGANGDDEVPF